LPALVLGDQQLALHVVHAPGEGLGAEPAEDDSEGGADARASEHRRRQLGDHAHVDAYVRALLDAKLLQRVGEAHDVLLQLAEGDLAAVVLRLAFPEVSDLVLETVLDVAVDAVVADVELAADVPLRVGGLPLVQLGPGLEERDAFGLVGPELVERAAVDLRPGVGLLAEVRAGRVPPLLDLKRLDGMSARGARTQFAHSASMPGSA